MRAKLRPTGRAATLKLPWIAAALLAGSPAMGLQPLEAFIAAAREQNPDAQRADANLAEQSAQADVSLGRQLPGVSVQASYLRNEYQVSLTLPTGQTFNLLPKNEWLGSANLPVPLVHLPNLCPIAAASTHAQHYAR